MIQVFISSLFIWPFFQYDSEELRVKGMYVISSLKQREFYFKEVKYKHDYEGISYGEIELHFSSVFHGNHRCLKSTDVPKNP